MTNLVPQLTHQLLRIGLRERPTRIVQALHRLLHILSHRQLTLESPILHFRIRIPKYGDIPNIETRPQASVPLTERCQRCRSRNVATSRIRKATIFIHSRGEEGTWIHLHPQRQQAIQVHVMEEEDRIERRIRRREHMTDLSGIVPSESVMNEVVRVFEGLGLSSRRGHSVVVFAFEGVVLSIQMSSNRKDGTYCELHQA